MVVVRPSVSKLGDLKDVKDSLIPNDDDLLIYNSSSSEFEAGTEADAIQHNNLQDIQGGSATERNHLTDTELGLVQTNIPLNDTHRGLVTGNPHVVTKADVGLSVVPNTDFTTAVGLNTAKDTNVTTNLSEGTSTTTTVDVNSSDGTNATLVSASTSRAGLLTKAKWDEIVANTSYSGIGHLPLTGGTLTGILATVGTQTITNAGTGNGILIDQNGNGVALNIDSEATTANAVSISYAGTGKGIDITSAGDGLGINASTTSQYSAAQFSNIKAGGSSSENYVQLARNNAPGSNVFSRTLDTALTNGPVMVIKQGSSTDDQNALSIQQDGTGNGLLIDQNGNGVALNIDSESTTSRVMNVLGVMTEGILFNLNNNGVGNNRVMLINQDNTGNTEGALKIQNDGTGNGLFIDQNGNGIGLVIDSEATTQPAIKIDMVSDVEVIDFDGCTDGGTSHTTLAGSLKIQMPNGATGYINFYT